MMGNKIPQYLQNSMYESVVLKNANNPTDNSIAGRKVAHGILSLQLSGEIEFEDELCCYELHREPIENLAYKVDYVTMAIDELYDEQKLPFIVEKLCKKMARQIMAMYMPHIEEANTAEEEKGE